jgi:hypothetical protein
VQHLAAIDHLLRQSEGEAFSVHQRQGYDLAPRSVLVTPTFYIECGKLFLLCIQGRASATYIPHIANVIWR